MTDFLPPPPELAQQWMTEFYGTPIVPGEACTDLAARAAQWGADQELEACLVEASFLASRSLADRIRAARRPKPPSLAKRALHILGTHGDLSCAEHDTIRRALEALDA